MAAVIAAAAVVVAPPARADVTTLGGVVMHEQRTHVVFWAPAGSGLQFDPGYEQLIETFLGRVAAASRSAGNEFGLMGQYGGPGGPAAYNSVFAGAVDDTNPAPSSADTACHEPPPPPLGEGPGWTLCVNDAGLQSELESVVHSHGLPVGFKDVYFLVLPRGFASCFDSGPSGCALGGDAKGGYCGYHADIGSARLLYAVIPYNALDGHCRSDKPRPNQSAADPTINAIAHELAETATDPLGDAWTNDSGDEIADICLKRFGSPLGGSSGSTAYNEVIAGGHYYLQELWSNAGHHCAAAAPAGRVAIRAPRWARRGARVHLTARASAPGRRVVSYRWTFGRGPGRRRARPAITHAWTRIGNYTVTVTVTDSWGDRVTARRQITIG
jgi:hypothetical protein